MEGKVRQTRDAQATQKQILHAAQEELAKRGLSGARIEAISPQGIAGGIATGGGFTTAMIHYYFDKA